MSVRRLNCPGCGIAVNVPVAMTNVRCPQCQTIWNANAPAVAAPIPNELDGPPPSTEQADDPTTNNAMVLIAMIGLMIVILRREPATPTAQVAAEETIKPAIPEPYREINKPEELRRRIYADYRTVARTTVEVPLALPQGTKARKNVEDTLQGVFDRELTAFAALHDITVADVKEVIKEGDAKQWDKSPRSHAVRDGKRVYTEEMSEGWQKNPNRK
jgi:hypothetical protein